MVLLRGYKYKHTPLEESSKLREKNIIIFLFSSESEREPLEPWIRDRLATPNLQLLHRLD